MDGSAFPLEAVSKGRFLACKAASSALPMLTYLEYAALRFSKIRLFATDSNLLKRPLRGAGDSHSGFLNICSVCLEGTIVSYG